MEVRPEPGILTGRESFTVGVQKSPTSSPAPGILTGRESFTVGVQKSPTSSPAVGILTGRESFTIGVQKSSTSSPAPVLHNMRMEFGGDAAAIYRPVTGGPSPMSYQSGGGELVSAAPAAAAGQGLVVNTGDPVKRKRGRPRKYAPDGSVIASVSSPTVPSSSTGPSTGFYLSYTSAAPLRQESSSLPGEQTKKARGRPLGSGKKHRMNALGLGGIGFIPHVITVKAGEDVSSKIMSFSHHGPRAVCILSANGAISNVTLRQAASSGGTVTYEGRFEILSLSGSFLLSESCGQRSRTGGLSVSLAGPDGRVLGGGVAGLLTAASPVQVVVGSFISDGGKKEAHLSSPFDAGPALVGLPGPSSPPSRGTMSESSGGAGPGSPLNQSTNGNNIQGLPNVSWK